MNKAIRLRQRMNDAHDDEGYWPGYVDALVNVVLNLLFLLALLTLAAFVLGQKVGQNHPDVVQKLEGQTAFGAVESPSPEIDTRSPPQKIQVKTNRPNEAEWVAAKNQLRVIATHSREDGRLISLNTPANARLMSQAQTPEFLADLKSQMSPNSEKIWIWTNTDSDPQRQRHDYLRVLQVRDWLLRIGMARERIHVRLELGGSSQQEVAPIFIWLDSERGEK